MEILTFNYENAGDIRTLDIDGEVWFVGKDAASLLGYKNTRQALSTHVDNEDKTSVQIQDGGSNYKSMTVIINESGLYSLILSSKLPDAKKFKRWVTSEVLPAVRKHGAYLTPDKIEEVLLNPDTIIKIATALKEERQKNKELTMVNQVLTNKANTLDNRAVIVALIRAHAGNRCNNNFVKAWNVFYKRLNYSLHINLRSRKNNVCNKNIKLIDLLTEKEMVSAAKTAVAICEEANLNAGGIISETNLARLK